MLCCHIHLGVPGWWRQREVPLGHLICLRDLAQVKSVSWLCKFRKPMFWAGPSRNGVKQWAGAWKMWVQTKSPGLWRGEESGAREATEVGRWEIQRAHHSRCLVHSSHHSSRLEATSWSGQGSPEASQMATRNPEELKQQKGLWEPCLLSLCETNLCASGGSLGDQGRPWAGDAGAQGRHSCWTCIDWPSQATLLETKLQVTSPPQTMNPLGLSFWFTFLKGSVY